MYLQVSIWKHVFKKLQSPRLSSVWGWSILAKCNFEHSSWLSLNFIHSCLVEWEQNSLTPDPVWDRKESINTCSLAVGFPKSSLISSLWSWSAFSFALWACKKIREIDLTSYLYNISREKKIYLPAINSLNLVLILNHL